MGAVFFKLLLTSADDDSGGVQVGRLEDLSEDDFEPDGASGDQDLEAAALKE